MINSFRETTSRSSTTYGASSSTSFSSPVDASRGTPYSFVWGKKVRERKKKNINASHTLADVREQQGEAHLNLKKRATA